MAPKKIKADSTRPELKAREFSEEIQHYLEDIDECQTALESLNEQASQEIIKVEQKYNKLRKPHLLRRSEYIQLVPNFWSICFTNHPDLSNLISSDGEEYCFHHLKKLDVQEADDIKSGYQISFYFTENPYFFNSILVKEYHLGQDGKPTSTSTPIEWKEGMNLLPNLYVTSTQVSRKRKPQSTSFFEWFNDHYDPTGDPIADIIKDDLWQTPLQYFLTPDVEMNGVDDEDEEDESTAEEDEEPMPQIDNILVSAPGPVDPLE